MRFGRVAHARRAVLQRVTTCRRIDRARRILLSLAIAPYQNGRAHGGRQTRNRGFGGRRIFAEDAGQEILSRAVGRAYLPQQQTRSRGMSICEDVKDWNGDKTPSKVTD